MRKRRGGRTVGWGQVGQHRKHGAKGGHGKAGLHKHKWSWVVKYAPDYFGSHGFTRPGALPRWVNVGELEALAARLPEEGGLPLLDLSSIGVDKLLGSGRLSRPLRVKVAKSTESARSKVEAAGGKVEEA